MLGFFQILASDLSSCDDYAPIVGIVKGILGIIQFAIPILLIIMGTIDLGKAVMSSDEKEIKASSTRLMKRAIAAIAVFLVSALVNLIMGMVSKETQSTEGANTANFLTCWREGTTGGAGASKNCGTPEQVAAVAAVCRDQQKGYDSNTCACKP